MCLSAERRRSSGKVTFTSAFMCFWKNVFQKFFKLLRKIHLSKKMMNFFQWFANQMRHLGAVRTFCPTNRRGRLAEALLLHPNTVFWTFDSRTSALFKLSSASLIRYFHVCKVEILLSFIFPERTEKSYFNVAPSAPLLPSPPSAPHLCSASVTWLLAAVCCIVYSCGSVSTAKRLLLCLVLYK